jgi:3-oxoacyl-[acyl-carrier-protein] synthase-1/3-oxoacyl-[acyl-carrier-protein] synthase II
MEARAIARALGEGATPVVHPFKAQIGHTLGAAGALEALAAAHALATAVAPAAAGDGSCDPDAPALLLEHATPRPLRAALKLSAAFGGSDAAIVLSRPHSPAAPRTRVLRVAHLAGWAHVTEVDLGAIADVAGVAPDRLARLDPLCKLGLAAIAKLARALGKGAIEGAGIVAGQALATLDTNDAFAARLRDRGPTAAPPRVFPATSPNALVGECAIAFRLTGPSFAVGAGLDAGVEALDAAAELVAARDADRVIVVAADECGPASRAWLHLVAPARPLARGAVAALLTGDGGGPVVPLGHRARHGDGPIGHLSLLRWLEGLG